MIAHRTAVTLVVESKRVTTTMGHVYVATCSCGWKSVQHDLYRDADAEADAHVRNPAATRGRKS